VILAESVSIAPEVVLLALLALVVLSIAAVVYAVGGFVVARRFGAGDRSRRVVVGMVLVVVIGAGMILLPVVNGSLPSPLALLAPLAHAWAVRRGRRDRA